MSKKSGLKQIEIIFQAFFLILAAAILMLVVVLASSRKKELISPQVRKGMQRVGDIGSRRASVILTGDVMLGRTVMTKSIDLFDSAYPFRKVADTLNRADIVFINLENPIITDCPLSFEGFKFCASPGMVDGLVFGGVDIVNLANNHSRNYGDEGLQETIKILNENNIEATGLGELVKTQVGEVEFGFLGFDFTISEPKEEDYDFIDFTATEVDVLIVGVHWGIEYTQNPTNAQKEWAEKMIFSGADILVGHGPHWVQEIELIEGKPVYYSLGNFVFDQMWSEETKKGLVVRLTFEGDEIVKEERLPIYMSSWAQPEFVGE